MKTNDSLAYKCGRCGHDMTFTLGTTTGNMLYTCSNKDNAICMENRSKSITEFLDESRRDPWGQEHLRRVIANLERMAKRKPRYGR